jgi:hypothetical protein
MLNDLCVCGHMADEHDELGDCQAPDCQCMGFELDPDLQTAPEVEFPL